MSTVAQELEELARHSDLVLAQAQEAAASLQPVPGPPAAIAAFETMVLLSYRAFARERELARRRALP